MLKKSNKSKKSSIQYTFLCIGTLVVVVVIALVFVNLRNQFEIIPLSQVIKDVRAGKVSEIDVADTKLAVKEGGTTYVSNKEPSTNVYQLFKGADIPLEKTHIVVTDNTGLYNATNLLSIVLPILIGIIWLSGTILFFTDLILLFIWLRRQLRHK